MSWPAGTYVRRASKSPAGKAWWVLICCRDPDLAERIRTCDRLEHGSKSETEGAAELKLEKCPRGHLADIKFHRLASLDSLRASEADDRRVVLWTTCSLVMGNGIFLSGNGSGKHVWINPQTSRI